MAADAAAAGMAELWLEVGRANRAARAVHLRAGCVADPTAPGAPRRVPGEIARRVPLPG